MTSIWNKNLSLFKERFASLYEILLPDIHEISETLSNAKDEKDFLSKINALFPFWIVEKSRSGNYSAKEKNDGNLISLHSSYDPEKEAIRFAEEQKDMTEGILLFEGMGLGYQMIRCAERFPEKTFILCEPDKRRFLGALTLLDFEKVFRLEHVVLAPSAPVETVVGITEAEGGFSKTRIVSIPSHLLHAKEYFENLNLLAKRNRDKAEINTNTLERFRLLWLKNSVRNLETTGRLSGVNSYFQRTNLPSVIFGAGPTLEEALPFVKEISNRAITICVDTALRSLLKAGLEPDFIVLTDPQYYAARHIHGLSSKHSVLITESAAYPSVFRFPCRKIVLCSSLFPMGKYFEDRTFSKGKLDSGGSVATTAWDFARKIGSKEIYFSGLDLGYPENKTHIKGSTFEEQSHTVSSRTKSAESAIASILFSAKNCQGKDFSGRPLITDSRMKLFAWWFESKIASDKTSQTFNFSERSLNIPGVRTASLKDFLERNEAVSEKEEFFETSEKSLSPETLEKFETVKMQFLSALKNLKGLSEKGIFLCNNILTDQRNVQENLASLSLLDKEILQSEVKEVAALVFPTERQLEKLVSKAKLPENPLFSNITRSRIVYSEILKAVNEYLKAFC